MSDTTTENEVTEEQNLSESATSEDQDQASETATADDDTQDAHDAEPDDEQDQQDTSKASRQAAKYRRQLRDTEAERDTLQEQVSTLRRTIAEESLRGVLAKPSALWLTGVEAADFYDDAGNLDTDALAAAAKDAAAQNGLQPFRKFGGSVDGGARESNVTPPRFSDMFQPQER